MLTGRSLHVLVSLSLVVGGCSGAARAEPRYASADPAAQEAFDRALSAFRGGDAEQAEQLFSSFVIAHPGDSLRPAAELHLGRLAEAEGDHDAATIWLERAAASSDASVATLARRELGRSLLGAGDARRALEVLEPLAGSLDGADAADLYALLAEAAGAAGDAQRQIRFLDALCRFADRDAGTRARGQIDALVGELDEAALAALTASLPRNGHGWSAATARLGVLAAQRGDETRAAQALDQLDQVGEAEGPAGDAVRAAIARMESLDWSAVGVLVPLSGRARLVGVQIQAGLELAATGADPPLRLVIRDSAAAEGGIAAVVDDLVRTEHVAAIIGPVDAGTAQAAAQRAQELGVPLLALSIRPHLTGQGRFVLRTFQSNEAEVRLLVGRAMERQGLRTFAILHPDQAYGRVLRDLVEQEVARQAGTVSVVRSYSPSQTSFVEICQELAQHDFDALVVPDQSRAVALIAPALAAAGIWSVPEGGSPPADGRGTQLLFPSISFDSGLIRQAGRYLQGALFASVLWVDDPAPEVVTFVEAYRTAHGTNPTPYASQAHDAVQLLLSARRHAAGHTRSALLDALLALRSAPTVGPFEGFDQHGEPTAPVRLLRLDGATFQPADP